MEHDTLEEDKLWEWSPIEDLPKFWEMELFLFYDSSIDDYIIGNKQDLRYFPAITHWTFLPPKPGNQDG